ncbi:hypothetical protein MAPG_07726 [Magnaporthiopsis poae ATCC 64411]|uniref:FAR-17a/AIG1-like protein n=1 Tax=Magnaporthiopsis poae (strain ATCC 64411 / 73-15) TaxID=644358 RepID=A0A0C4E5G0_MAGP6|nr:hypothetical protein MAPG_07726 [Magnaporthiopsis poae ATCC 64411]
MAPKVFSFGSEPFDPSHRYVTSWLFSPWILFGVRALLSLYAFVTSFFHLGWICQHVQLGGCEAASREFSYFTVLTFWALAFYFLVSAIHTGTYAMSGRALLDIFPRPLQALHSLYYTTICVFPLIVTVVYWGILFTEPFDNSFSWWSNVSRHAMNMSFALFEIIFTRTSLPPWIHILWLIIILALYLALAYLTRATRGFYVYPFLDPSKGGRRLAGYVCGITISCVIFFLLVRGLIWVRTWVAETKLGMTGKFSSHDGTTKPHDPESTPKMEQSQQH